jgi:antirestriction protein
MSKHSTEPRIYVGTYGHYNNGSLKGQWFDLTDFTCKEDFEAACQAFHGPGEHEFMYQDHEGIPDRFIGESYLDEEVWEKWVDLDDDDKELLEVYLEHIDSDGDLDKAKESFSGKFDDESDWAQQYWDDSGMLSEVPAHARNYIDFAQYAKDCQLGGDMSFIDHEGECWAFNNNA